MRKAYWLCVTLSMLLWSTACSRPATTAAPLPTSTIATSPTEATGSGPTQEVSMSLELTSSAFGPGGSIPDIYTCKGQGISPALMWSGVPSGTQSLAVITDDPDAPSGTFVHWVIFNIPVSSRGLPEAVPTDPQLSDGAVQGNNGAGRPGYTGPCPPSGTHRYFFKLYALDTTLTLEPGASKDQLLNAMDGHILGQAELMGTFSK